MMQRRIYMIVLLIIVLSFQLPGLAQENPEKSVTFYTEEGGYCISFPNADVIETRFTAKDSATISKPISDSLLINLGTASENITLSTVPVRDSLNITLEGLKLLVVQEPFSINYQFSSPWYDLKSGKKFASGSSYRISNKEALIPKLARGGTLIPLVKTDRDKLWQVHYFFEADEKEKNQKFCPEDFNAVEGEDCIEVSYQLTGKEILINVNAVSTSPTTDEMELVLHGLENRIEFVWLNNIKYTAKNFVHEGKQFIPLRFDSPENVLRIELK